MIQMSDKVKRVTAALLLVVGVQFWLIVLDGLTGDRLRQRALAAGVVAGVLVFLALSPRWQAWRARLALRRPRRGWIALGLTVLAAVYLFTHARRTGASLAPYVTDELCYAMQANMVGGGRLWMPPHELGEWFASFHVITGPVLAVKYPPATAVAFAAAGAVGVPAWVVTVLATACAVGLLYLVVARTFGDGYGLAAAAMLFLGGHATRTGAVLQMSQPLMLPIVVLCAWLYLRWRGRPRALTAMALGAALGLGAVTRPADAVAVAASLAFAELAFAVRRGERSPGGGGPRVILVGLAAAAVGGAPFVAAQLAYNRALTGTWTTLPWSYYAARNDPYDNMGTAAIDAAAEPPTPLPQKQLFAETSRHRYADKRARSYANRYFDIWLQTMLLNTLAHPLLGVLIPVGVMAVGRRDRLAVWAFGPVFVAVYTMYTVHGWQYAIAFAPAAAVMVVAGCRAVGERFGARGGAATAAACVVVGLAAAVMEDPRSPDPAQPLIQIDRALAAIPGRAIVLFEFDKGWGVSEVVYNVEHPWPDDAPVIRAHDLPDNRPLLQYYAARQPDRDVYVYRAGDRLERLGNVVELAR